MRMLVMDVDGTCLNSSHRISNKTLNAMRMAAEAGIEIVPATGRALSCLPGQLKNERYIRYVISSNGAVVTDIRSGKTIYGAQIPSATACGILDACKDINSGIEAHVKFEPLVESSMPMVFGDFSYGYYSYHNKRVRNLHSYLESSNADAEKLRFYVGSSSMYRYMKDMLDNYPGIITDSPTKYIEVYADKATKGDAVSELAKHLGFRNEHIACVGDGRNDLSMFQVCGMNFAMANAVQDLKNSADYIVPSNNRNGVATVIEKYLLKVI